MSRRAPRPSERTSRPIAHAAWVRLARESGPSPNRSRSSGSTRPAARPRQAWVGTGIRPLRKAALAGLSLMPAKEARNSTGFQNGIIARVNLPPLLEYRQYTAQIIAEHPAMFIGALVWFSIAGTVAYVNNKRTTIPVSVPYETLKQHFDDLNL